MYLTASFALQVGSEPSLMRAILNHTLNFIWTGLCFLSVLWHWIPFGMDLWFYLILAFSLLLGFLPGKGIQKLQLSNDRKFYERVGVKYIKRFVQDGDLVKKQAGKKVAFRVIKSRSQAIKYLKTISMYERYHLIGFAFFSLSSIHIFFTRNIF
jgi:hypothetical protein